VHYQVLIVIFLLKTVKIIVVKRDTELDEAKKIADSILEARGKTVFFTGAGVSTESGIPDFRGPQGLWTRISPEIFSLDVFLQDPYDSWIQYIENIYKPVSKAFPNSAHRSIAELEAMGLVEAVITQNIDKLHQKAGSRRVIELHGSYDEVQCTKCNFKGKIDEHVQYVLESNAAPRCRICGSLLKPAVVYFGEPLPERELNEAFVLASSCKVMIVVGTSLTVFPAALIPRAAISSGAELFIINETPTPLDNQAILVIREKAGNFLPEVVEVIKEEVSSERG
jgi:NAD-dependent deacetylase